MKEKSRLKAAKAFFAIAVLFLLICIFNNGDGSNDQIKTWFEEKDCEIVSHESYYRDGEKCMGYRIYINRAKIKPDNFRSIYNYIINNEDYDYYLHTIWFFYSKSSAGGTGIADAIMEETSSGLIPEVQLKN